MSVATMTSKGQLTVPAEVREKLRLKAGDKVRFEPMVDGTYRLVAKTGSIRELKGCVPPLDRPVTIDEMEEAVVAGAVARFERNRH